MSILIQYLDAASVCVTHQVIHQVQLHLLRRPPVSSIFESPEGVSGLVVRVSDS